MPTTNTPLTLGANTAPSLTLSKGTTYYVYNTLLGAGTYTINGTSWTFSRTTESGYCHVGIL